MTYRIGINVMERLVNREVVTPYIEQAIQRNRWPEEYVVEHKKHGAGNDGLFHPSSHTMQGERWLYMQLHPEMRKKLVRKPFNYTSIMTMSAGTAMHALLQAQLVENGLSAPEDIEVKVYNEKHHFTGHMDAAITLPNGKKYPIDIKTTNSANFDRMTAPYESYILQMLCYMYALGYDEGYIVFLEMGRPFRLKEFRVAMDEANKMRLRKLFDKWDYVWECIQNNTPPRPCCAPGSKDSKTCSAASICYSSEGVPLL